MAVGSPLMVIVLAWLIAAAVLAVVGIVWLFRKRVILGLAMLATGLLMALAPVAVVVWGFYFGGTVEFRAGGVDGVAATFQKQHPEGVVTTPGTLPPGSDVSVWHLSGKDVRFDLIAHDQGDWFTLQTQAAVVLPADPADHRVRIPYPVFALGEGSEMEGVPTFSDWTADQWRDFYKDIGDVRFGDNTITVPTNRGGTATLTFGADGSYTIAING